MRRRIVGVAVYALLGCATTLTPAVAAAKDLGDILLKKGLITEDELKQYLLWQITFFRFLDFRFRHATSLHCSGEKIPITPGLHIHVDAGMKRKYGRLGGIGNIAVVQHFAD